MSRQQPLLIPCIIWMVLPLVGCRGSASGKREAAKGQRLVPDKRFAGTKPVALWEITVKHSLMFPGRDISGEESPEQRRLRAAWVQRSTLTSRILLHPKRLVWILPSWAMPGGEQDELHLILRPEANVAAVVSHKRKIYWADTPAQVAAWVEGALRPSPTLARFEVLAQATEGTRSGSAGSGSKHTTHTLRGLLVPHAGRGRKSQPPQYNLRSRAVDASTFGGPSQGQSLLWDMALLPLLAATSDKSLAAVRGRMLWPLQVDLRLARTEPPGAPWLRLTLGLGSRKRRHVAPRLLRLPPGQGYRRMFGPLTYAKGRQLQRRPMGKPYKRRKKDPRQATLVVQNATTRTAYVYADGVLLGWTGPHQTFTLRTGEPGYYRVTTRSLFGTTHWGPKDLYIPGEIRLGPK